MHSVWIHPNLILSIITFRRPGPDAFVLLQLAKRILAGQVIIKYQMSFQPSKSIQNATSHRCHYRLQHHRKHPTISCSLPTRGALIQPNACLSTVIITKVSLQYHTVIDPSFKSLFPIKHRDVTNP